MSKAIRLGPKLKELRIHLCQTGASSKGVRDFIEKYYVGIKRSNPAFPILIRECSHVEPRMWARFEKGKESSVALNDLGAEDILKKVETVAR